MCVYIYTYIRWGLHIDLAQGLKNVRTGAGKDSRTNIPTIVLSFEPHAVAPQNPNFGFNKVFS